MRMKKMSSDESREMLVDICALPRCDWCGARESVEWIGTNTGKVYCSKECQEATTVGARACMGLFFLAGAVIAIFALHPGGILLLAAGILMLWWASRGERYLDRKDKYLTEDVSEKFVIACMYCGHKDRGSFFKCSNCGAPLS